MSTNAIQRVRVKSDSADLAVFIHPGSADPIVLLHGGPGVPDYLGPVAALLEHRRRVIRFDQRGVGGSVAFNDSYSADHYIQDLDSVRDHLGVERIHLFGHSWGGMVAQLYWAKHPERVSSLFLSNSSTGVGSQWKQMDAAVMRYNRRQAGLGGSLAMGVWWSMAIIPGAIGDAAARRLFARVWRNYFAAAADAPKPDLDWLRGVRSRAMRLTRKSMMPMSPDRLPDRVEAPGIPVLILFGGRDIYGAESEVLLARFPSAHHVLLEDSGHLPWIDDPPGFEGVVSDFYP